MTENSFKMAIKIAQSNQQDENAYLPTKTVSTYKRLHIMISK